MRPRHGSVLHSLLSGVGVDAHWGVQQRAFVIAAHVVLYAVGLCEGRVAPTVLRVGSVHWFARRRARQWQVLPVLGVAWLLHLGDSIRKFSLGI